jgi:hypothetical protein
MAPKTKAAKLSEIAPTEEELATARKTIAKCSKTDMATKRQCMGHFLRQNPDDAAAKSRGSDRGRYLEHYLVHMMRVAAAKKNIHITKEAETNDSKTLRHQWMSRELMDKTVGAEKGAHWREAGKLLTRPDPVTGSTDPNFIEWRVPEDWSSHTETDKDSFAVKTDKEADQTDLDNLKSVFLRGGGQASNASDVAEVKEEPLSELDELEQKCNKLKDDTRQHFDEYHAVHTYLCLSGGGAAAPLSPPLSAPPSPSAYTYLCLSGGAAAPLSAPLSAPLAPPLSR